jgi:hypothetical protein
VHGWRITRTGRVVLAVLAAGLAGAFVAPSPWSDVSSIVVGFVLLFWAMDSFVGGTRGGAYGRLPAPEDERVALFRRLYRARRRES